MRWSLLMLLACGCNRVFGLGATELVDAQVIDAEYFDAPADAAPTCPPIGDVPRFRTAFAQIPADGCTHYVPSTAGIALAQCNMQISLGPTDGALAAAAFPAAYSASVPRFAPEGDLAILETGNDPTFELFRRQADETWVLDRLVYPPASTRKLTTPTRGPDRRTLMFEFDTDHVQLTELIDNGSGPWTPGLSYSIAEMGLYAVLYAALSADGLRLVVDGIDATERAIFFASRNALGEKFGMAKVMSSVPKAAVTPYMTEDCGRIYFSALGAVFYLGQ